LPTNDRLYSIYGMDDYNHMRFVCVHLDIYEAHFKEPFGGGACIYVSWM